MGVLADGRKVFVWNALPGEHVHAQLVKSKKDYAEAIAEQVLTASVERVTAQEPHSYLATSPWQILDFSAENVHKKAILQEAFEREGVTLPDSQFISGGEPYGYRNKMEWGFWGDEQGIQLAHFVRGSHGKVCVTGSALTQDAINTAANALIRALNKLPGLRAGDLKSVILRSSAQGVVAALFVKKEDFAQLQLPTQLKGLVVYYSNPKSPASVPTKLLQSVGERTLQDNIAGAVVAYDVLSFFQVNLLVFQQALGRIAEHTSGLRALDFYSGVGSIGITLPGCDVLVESDPTNIAMAKQNVAALPRSVKVVGVPAEKALDYIDAEHVLVVDPPRAGLHADVIARIDQVKPPMVVYLSCNPSTQARDISQLLASGYSIVAAEGYNFFPRTPHIESLVVLKASNQLQ